MNGRALIARIVAPLVKAAEGAFRPGPYILPVTGGYLPDGTSINYWQLGQDPLGMSSQSAMVEACLGAYSQTVAMCPGSHWRTKSNGGRERVTNSALARILKRPNAYQSISDFLLNGVRQLYAEGNAYALAIRNSRFEIIELHLMESRECFPQIAVTGDIFYHLAGNEVIAQQLGAAAWTVPARDVLHIRLHTNGKRPRPLRGETPLLAALMDMTASNAIQRQQIQFWMNQARPSAVLSTDAVLRPEQVQQLRNMWAEQSKGLEPGCGPGGTPILTAGLKVVPWATPGKDAQIAEMMQMSDEKIALAFRIPLPLLGMGSMRATASVELLMQSWISTGLGFCLNHVELAFDGMFGLKGGPEEYTELDTAALLRSAFKDRIEGLVKAVQGGVLSPNEARISEGYPEVEYGQEPRVQQQVVPLSAAAGIEAAPGPGAPPSAPPAAAAEGDNKQPGAAAAEGDNKQPGGKPPKQNDYHAGLAIDARTILAEADRHDRRRLRA